MISAAVVRWSALVVKERFTVGDEELPIADLRSINCGPVDLIGDTQ